MRYGNLEFAYASAIVDALVEFDEFRAYGVRISDDDRAYIDGLISRRGSIQRYQARLNDHMFKLNIEPI